MRIVVGGASGLIGTALVKELRAQGHHVQKLVRREQADGDIPWDPNAGKLNASQLNGIDALIHLSGEGVASGRWTAASKRPIPPSRVVPPPLLARANTARDPPRRA